MVKSGDADSDGSTMFADLRSVPRHANGTEESLFMVKHAVDVNCSGDTLIPDVEHTPKTHVGSAQPYP